jgi:hypothetical protein
MVRGQLPLSDALILYPTLLLSTQTPDFFVSELIGGSPYKTDLTERHHQEASIHRYLAQFDLDVAHPIILDEGSNLASGLLLMQARAETLLQQRFPHVLKRMHTALKDQRVGDGALIELTPDANFAAFTNCMLVNAYDTAVRIKDILFLFIVRRSTSRKDYVDYLRENFGSAHIYGTRVIEKDEGERYDVASQFANVYLFPGLRETTIGDFVNAHPDIVRKAFCTDGFLYEPYFEWQPGTTAEEEKAINPDLMIQRQDGHYDIWDLKPPLLARANITKGGRSRRRFIDSVEEGVAQLAHYADYFSHEANRQYALERYGITVDNPHLGLIVGNEENVTRAQVDEACRRLKSFELIDYDTLLQLYLKSTC